MQRRIERVAARADCDHADFRGARPLLRASRMKTIASRASRLSAASVVPLLLLAACAVTPSSDGDDQSSAFVGAGAVGGKGGSIGSTGGPLLSDRTFAFRGLGNRCWDFGGEQWWAVGVPVYLYTCNGTVAQQIRVKEIDAAHDVELRVQDRFCIGVRGGRVAVGAALELQPCNGSPGQRFALDGDAVMMGTQSSGNATRDFVIEPLADATPHRTPLVVGARDVNDAEYFRAYAVDGSAASPTTGFVKVASEAWLDWALSLGWGTVIEIDDRAPLTIASPSTKEIHAGVTLRGYRKYAYQGPEIVFPFIAGDKNNHVLFDASEDNVRITALRMRGPTRSTDGNAPKYQGIKAHEANRVIVDHVDGSDWTDAFVAVEGTDRSNPPVCPATPPPYPRPANVRVVGCFIHHNERENSGYGVVMGAGGFARIEGMLAYDNRHSIAADGWGLTGYEAFDNFVLSDAPCYGFLCLDHEQDFDKHGTLDPGHWNGGISDDYVDIGWNTFLGTNRHNVDERGTPCRFTRVHDGVFMQSEGGAIRSQSTSSSKLSIYGNQFDASNPTDDLAVGDFDGDGVDDVFVGTGTGWWFSSAGKSEWRFLSRKPEHATALRFGDFDADGRTDVLALHGANLDVSWAGISPWQTINVTAWSLSDLAIGDFDGDRYADIFLATGNEWFYAPAGRNWTHFAWSTYRTSQLRFGDFTGDRKTDVFGVVANQWMIVRGGGDSWEPLRTALTSTVDGLFVADFDGDGFADVMRQSGSAWQYAARGWGGFVTLRSTSASLAGLPIGRFDGDAKADVLEWSDRHFSLASGARDPASIWSTQDMR